MKLLIKISLFFLLASPGLAVADINPMGPNDAWTVYAFGNASVLAGILLAASGMMNESFFLTLVAFVGVVSVLIMSTMSIQGGMDGRRIGAVILGVALMGTVGIKEKSNVYVWDPVFGNGEMVQNVPAVVAVPAAVVTTLGHNITALIEKHFTTPNGLSLSTGGAFNLTNSLISASTKVEVQSPYLRASVNRFMQDCVVPSIAGGWVSSSQILVSDNLWGNGGVFSNVNPSIFTVVYSGNRPTGVVAPCKEAGLPVGASGETIVSSSYPGVSAKGSYEYIQKYLNTASTEWLKQQAGLTGGDTWLVNTLNAAQKYVFNTTSYDSARSLEQAAAINTMRPSIMALSAQVGTEASNMGFAVASAEQSQRSSWAMSAILFQDLAGYAYSVLQAFIIGLTPIMFVMMMLPGGLKVAKNYGAILLWLALWEPTLGIINYVIQLYAQGNLAGVAATGYSIMNTALIDARTNNFVLAASALAAAVPMITWGIIKGGNAFTSYIAGGIGTQFANKGAELATSGNRDYGNVKAHNSTLDQQMLAMRTVSGNMGSDSHFGGATRHLDYSGISASVGGTSMAMQAQKAATMLSGEASKVTQQATSERNQAFEAASQYTDRATSSLMQSLGAGKGSNTTTNASETGTVGGSSQTGVDMTTSSEAIDKLTRDANAQLDARAQFNFSAGVMGNGASGHAGGGIGIAFKKEDGTTESVKLADLDKWVRSASGEEQAQRAQQASQIFNALSEATKGVNQEASDGFKQAAIANEKIATSHAVERTAQDTQQLALTYSSGHFDSNEQANQALAQIQQAREMMLERQQSLHNLSQTHQSTRESATDGVALAGQDIPDPRSQVQAGLQTGGGVRGEAEVAATQAGTQTSGVPGRISADTARVELQAETTLATANGAVNTQEATLAQKRDDAKTEAERERRTSTAGALGRGADIGNDLIDGTIGKGVDALNRLRK